jgi:L-asparaginase
MPIDVGADKINKLILSNFTISWFIIYLFAVKIKSFFTMSVLIVVTGGTFDKEYNELTGELFFKETHLKEMLILGRNLVSLRAHTLMMVDSLNMTEEERQQIVNYCLKAPEKQVIITHGTDTMVQTAGLLANQIKDKTIILTGAMIPYKFGSSDGLFNMGSALAFVQSLPSGVYVAMNGRYFDAHNVKKNRKDGVFEELHP